MLYEFYLNLKIVQKKKITHVKRLEQGLALSKHSINAKYD